jgi:hypothetical protein
VGNNPAVVAYAEACRIAASCQRPGIDPVFQPSQAWMLSVGSGQHSYFVTPPGDDAGIAYWGPRILDVIGASQSQGVDCEARYLFAGDRYIRIDFTPQDRSWTLDTVKVLPRLVHLGREAAIAHWDKLKSSALDGVRPPYAPF